MKIKKLFLVEGAREAEGITVIIDVFRAFTLEAYLYAQNTEDIYAVSSKETAYALKEEHPDVLLCGERGGKILPGFDFGNSPSVIKDRDFKGKTILHTTTNGTQGIANAGHADAILTGSFVNAKATAEWIERQNPSVVSLVCMGWETHRTEEDELCADYLSALLRHEEMPDLEERLLNLKYQEGKKFFDPAQQEVFPEEDFWMCVKHDIFDFAIAVKKEGEVYHCVRA